MADAKRSRQEDDRGFLCIVKCYEESPFTDLETHMLLLKVPLALLKEYFDGTHFAISGTRGTAYDDVNDRISALCDYLIVWKEDDKNDETDEDNDDRFTESHLKQLKTACRGDGTSPDQIYRVPASDKVPCMNGQHDVTVLFNIYD